MILWRKDPEVRLRSPSRSNSVLITFEGTLDQPKIQQKTASQIVNTDIRFAESHIK